MGWRIERDKDGEPVRMWWTGPDPSPCQVEAERQLQIYRNGLPMPAMREWAEKHGLVQTAATSHHR